MFHANAALLSMLYIAPQHWFAFFPLMCGCCGLPLGIAAVGLWIWMLIDCATNEPSEGNTKVVWIIVIVLTGWIGALIYLLARRPQRKREVGK